MNHYRTLGISENADEETTRRAFRSLARRYHPDKGPGSSSEKFQRIVEAYEVLRDPIRREAYDASLRVQQNPERHVHVENLRAEPFQVGPIWLQRRSWSSPSLFFENDPFEEFFEDIFRIFESF